MSVTIRYVFELKGQGYPMSYIEEAFDSIVTDWEGASKFVKNETMVDGIIDFCKKQAEKAAPTFFLLGMRQATVNVKQALEKLEEGGFFEETGYQKKVTISEEGNHPRMEVIFIK